MHWIDWFRQWGDLLIGALAVAMALAALLRILVLRIRTNQMRRVIVGCWENYLEALSVSIERLKSLRAYLAQVRPSPDEPALQKICETLYGEIRSEIENMEQQLTVMAEAPDEQWYRMAIEWRPALPMRDRIAQLIENLRLSVSPEKLDALKARWRESAAAEFQEGIAQLEQDIRELHAQLEEALARAEEADELRRQLNDLRQQIAEHENNQTEADQSSPHNAESDEAIAARFMAQLADDFDLEQAAAKVAACDGEIHFLEQQVLENSDPDESQHLHDRIAWAHQTRRWWNILHMLRRKSLQLDEMSGKAMDSGGDDEEERLRAIQEFQEMEARNAEMKGQIEKLSASNRHLTVELEQFDSTKATLDQLRETYERVELARKSTQRELDNVEKMLGQMETELARFSKENKRLSKIENQLDDAQAEAITRERRITELEHELKAEKKSRSDEIQQLEQVIAQMEQETQTPPPEPDTAGMVPEEEMFKLQTAYDELNSHMIQARAARSQAEKSELKLRETLTKLNHDHNQLLARYQELKQASSR